MRFGVLGPLAVWTDDGTPVPVPEAKVRALLADLLVTPGRFVSADRLVEDLWGSAPPGKPVPTLRAKISQLRKALDSAEPGARALLEFRSGAYRLDIDAEAVDAGRFAALSAQARTSPDARARAAALAGALDIWRGEAFAEFADAPFAAPARTRLHDQRLAAQEDHAAARLELGEHTGVAADLAELVARHPHRERLQALHLRALYGSGRQAEALESYQRVRARLADELGIDPGPELSALHSSMLRQEPALTATAPGHNLPAAVSELIGRDGDLESVRERLSAGRLVTLTGPGGVGKTRLGLEIARAAAESFSDGAWLVELAAIDTCCAVTEAEVADAIAAVLGLRDEVAGSPRDGAARLAEALRGKNLLLLLDNCEHVIDATAALADRLLAAAPGVRLLATSREPLHLPGEQLWSVQPLALPDGETPAAVRDSSAAQLFLARAAAAGFDQRDDDAAVIAAICHRLDGLPLALELAASRVRGLGLRELAARLDDRFDLLTARNRRAPTRHQTLRAVIDWSWGLLDEQEQIVLRRLSVFADGCTLDAAEAVCANDPSTLLDVLTGLVDRSLVTVGFPEGRPRYRLLESVAAYCRERLAEAEETGAARQRARRYHAELAERAEAGLRSSEQPVWLRRLDLELPNLRSSLDDSVRQGDTAATRHLAAAASWHLFLRGRFREAHQLLAGAGTDPVVAACRDSLAVLSGAARDVARERPEITDPVARARAECFLEFVHLDVGDYTGPAHTLERALRTFRQAGDRWGEAAALTNRARRGIVRGELAASRQDATTAKALFDELGDQWGQLQAAELLARVAEITGDYAMAARTHRDGLRIAEELGLASEAANKLSGLGRIALLTGDLEASEAHHRRAADLAAAARNEQGLVYAEFGLALTARRQGRLDDAEQLWQRQLRWSRRAGDHPGVALALAELGFIAEQRADADTATRLHTEGLATAESTEDPRAIALALEGLAGAKALLGDTEAAARLLGRAAVTRESVGAPLPRAERADVDRITARAREAAPELFAAAYAEGRAEQHLS
ncbi:Predicted ATPase [Saccharopolyspora kobensis]|uniref:Predicted ATPase n=3 Tax=Saccharopolyspora kobensis TaxID=146035 RepID=A0A1H6EIZ3_9PSEU|nr:BTAD domain-containing putative transcriptional regulator [Saccharopolyspora kobensis]SEG96879.1 Predicted ATPase [Saccharopolyspora kobensis]SFE64361.1 Predicted ATPase [Saccharopolyspora kobensis]